MDKNKISNKIILNIFIKKVFFLIVISSILTIFVLLNINSLMDKLDIIREENPSSLDLPFEIIGTLGTLYFIALFAEAIWTFIVPYFAIKTSFKKYLSNSNISYEHKEDIRVKVRLKLLVLYAIVLPFLYLVSGYYYKDVISSILIFEVPSSIIGLIYLYTMNLRKVVNEKESNRPILE